MAQETKVEETRCSLQTFERNRYFYGKPMTVSDFEAEQRYLIGKQRYINRLVHGAGVLCGLQVTLPANFDAENPTVEVAEGAALDCCGNLIVVSRSSTVEVKGDYEPGVVNYLFIKYTECSKHPVMLSANGSSCEEVSCYNRIQEPVEVVASTPAPAALVAPKTPPPTTPPAGPLPDPATICPDLIKKYYKESLTTCPGCDDPLVFLAVLNAKEGELDDDAAEKYRSVVFNNPMLHELLCDHTTDFTNPHRTSAKQVRALQSVNNVGNNDTRSHVANIDLDSSDKTLAVAPNSGAKKIDLTLNENAVKLSHLNEEVVSQLVQSSNTVKVARVGPKSISLNTTPAASVTSVGRNKVVGASASFAPEDHAHDLSEGVVDRKHLGEDVYKNLVQSGGGIKVEADAAARTIRLSADLPAVPAPGNDGKLLSSVTGTKQVGKSERDAREEHPHDLRINGLSPKGNGESLLAPGANVRIEKGAAENTLVISAEGGRQNVVATGVWVFENVLPLQVRTSDLIPHGLELGRVAVILAEEVSEGLSLRAAGNLSIPLNPIARFGDVTAFYDLAPFLMAEVHNGQTALIITLKDRRDCARVDNTVVKVADESNFRFAPAEETAPTRETDLSGAIDPSGLITPSGVVGPSGTGDGIIIDPDARSYSVRWWAIPA